MLGTKVTGASLSYAFHMMNSLVSSFRQSLTTNFALPSGLSSTCTVPFHSDLSVAKHLGKDLHHELYDISSDPQRYLNYHNSSKMSICMAKASQFPTLIFTMYIIPSLNRIDTLHRTATRNWWLYFKADVGRGSAAILIIFKTTSSGRELKDVMVVEKAVRVRRIMDFHSLKKNLDQVIEKFWFNFIRVWGSPSSTFLDLF